MSERRKTYQGEGIQVQYNLQRCIHAAKCVHGLPPVFDAKRRPWIDPTQGTADAIAEVVLQCPSGALHFTRTDGGTEETPATQNTISISQDGPLYLEGDIEVTSADGTLLLKDTRVALCRCGASKNKPFCDNSHLKIDFKDGGLLKDVQVKPTQEGEDHTIRVRPSKNGPYLVQGPLHLVGTDDAVEGSQAALCRCGGSSNKPFCDGTHRAIDFAAD